MDALAELSSLDPQMRFGQLIEMLALLSSEETPMSASDIDDDRFVRTASHHLRLRRQQLKAEDSPMQDHPLPESRAELLDALRRCCERYSGRGFGHIVKDLATLSGSGLYDAEDEELVAAARSQLVG
jgi:hypothetical protein